MKHLRDKKPVKNIFHVFLKWGFGVLVLVLCAATPGGEMNQEAAVVPRWTEWPFRELEVDQEGYPLNLTALSQEEREDFLAGDWVEQPDQWKDRAEHPGGPTHDFYRTSSGNYGYSYYEDRDPDNYYPTPSWRGQWRLNGNLIEVKQIQDTEWQVLGSLESARLGLVNDTNGALEVEPARISLRYFYDGELSEETKFFWIFSFAWSRRKGLRYGDLERYCGPVSTRRRQPQTP